MAPMQSQYALATLVTTDEYLPAALVLAHSFKITHDSTTSSLTDKDAAVLTAEGATHRRNVDLVALVTPATLSVQSIRALIAVYDRVIGVEALSIESVVAMQQLGQIAPSNHANGYDVAKQSDVNLDLLQRPDLGKTKGAALTKLHAWRLIDYQKVLFLDADTLILRPIVHLLAGSFNFAASPDIGWPDIFNSGVMVLTPSETTFASILELAAESGTWDGADQGLLNDFYGGEKGTGTEGPGGGWTRLRFAYNTTSIGGYTYAPAFKRYGSESYIAHFIGNDKPWRVRLRPTTSSASVTQDSSNLNYRWWSIYNTFYPSPSSTPTSSRRGEADVEVRFTDRGAEVLERSKKSTFQIPTYASAWESRGDSGIPARPATVEELQIMFSGGLSIRGDEDGRYESLPLFNRIDLIPPLFDQSKGPSEDSRALASAPEIVISGASPQPQQQEPHVHWDATVTSPPHSSGPESYQMRNPIDAFYANAWDQPRHRSAEEEERKRRLNQWVQPGFIPEEARKIHDFSHLSEKPDAKSVRTVFPWESSSSSSQALPTILTPSQKSTGQNYGIGSTHASSPVSQATRRFDDYVTPPAAPSPSSFSAGSLVERYSNAWDNDPLSLSAASASERKVTGADATDRDLEARRQGQRTATSGQRSRTGTRSGSP